MRKAAWREHRALIFFGSGATILYWLHLAMAFVCEWRERGEHEQFAGIPHPARLLQRMGDGSSERFENVVRLWAEPAATLVCAVVLRWFSGERDLCRWLIFVAFCL